MYRRLKFKQFNNCIYLKNNIHHAEQKYNVIFNNKKQHEITSNVINGMLESI